MPASCASYAGPICKTISDIGFKWRNKNAGCHWQGVRLMAYAARSTSHTWRVQ